MVFFFFFERYGCHLWRTSHSMILYRLSSLVPCARKVTSLDYHHTLNGSETSSFSLRSWVMSAESEMYSTANKSFMHTFLSASAASTTAIEEARCPPPVSSDKDDCRPPLIKTGDCLFVNFTTNMSRQFVGLVTQKDETGAEIQFLRKTDKSGLVFALPTKEDKSWICLEQIVKHLSTYMDNRGRYHFSEPVQAEWVGLDFCFGLIVHLSSVWRKNVST